LYNDKDLADIAFLVEGKEARLHKFILKEHVTTLFEMAVDFNGAGPIPIPCVDTKIFNVIVRFVYTILDVDDPLLFGTLDDTESICRAADRFGCAGLKPFAGLVLVDKYMTEETCLSLLVLSDLHSYPLLKEACFGLYKRYAASLRRSPDWSRLVAKSPELLDELLAFVSLGVLTNADDDIAGDVTTLRTRLDKAGLHLDGTKSILLQRWKSHVEVPPLRCAER
jgi:hypothetical protein